MGRKKKTEVETPAAKPALTADEQAIAGRYGIEIKPGSLHYDEVRKKRVFSLYCAICKKIREGVATQDAFQVRTCSPDVSPECKKTYKAANK